jgi:lysozyme
MNRNTKIALGILVGAGASYYIYKKYFTRDISEKGLKFLIGVEGKRNKMYLDSKGLPTTGVGHLINPVSEKPLMTKTLTESEIETLLNKDLDRFEKTVNETIKIKLPQHKKDALYSLAFNIGEKGFRTSTLARLINQNAPQAEIIKAFAAWKKPSDIIGRRAKEIRLFTTGNYSPFTAATSEIKYFV